LTPDLDEAISAAVDHALIHNMATVISRDGLELLTVIPDVVLLELVANGTTSQWRDRHASPRWSIGPRRPSVEVSASR
jgi:hypothetical protein